MATTLGATSDYLENIILNLILRAEYYMPPDNIFLALYTSDPTDANIGQEVTGAGYKRMEITFDPASGGVSLNDSDITFPTAQGTWGKITHGGILDDKDAGNLLFRGAFEVGKEITAGDQYIIRAGKLKISFV